MKFSNKEKNNEDKISEIKAKTTAKGSFHKALDT